MRAANIATFIAASFWFGLVIIGRNLVGGVAGRMGGNVNIGQYDFYVLWPSYVMAGILACAWACNLFRRGYWLLGLISGASLLALLPFLILYGGGV